MPEGNPTSRIRLLVSPHLASELEATLKMQAIAVSRPTVGGQTLGPEALALAQLVVALGGGLGIAAAVKAVGEAIAGVIKAKRGTVKLKTAQGEISLENYNSEQVCEILTKSLQKR